MKVQDLLEANKKAHYDDYAEWLKAARQEGADAWPSDDDRTFTAYAWGNKICGEFDKQKNEGWLYESLNEARQAQWAYTEKRVKGALDKVTLALEGADSGAMTRLAKRYERLDKSAKLLKEKRDQLNAAVKEVGDRIFDAEDALATRIIDTITYTVMLTASEKAENKKPTAKVDYESAFSELARLVPELVEQMDKVRAKYTEMIPPKDTPVGLRVKAKVQESLLTAIKVMWTKFMDSIKQWGRSYDSKLDAIKNKFPVKGKRI